MNYPTKFLQVNGGTIAYDDTEGTGQPVVCLPLMGDMRQLFRFTRERLVNAGYRVITMDLRGLGESSVNWPEYTVPAMGLDVLMLVEHLNLKDVVLVGESISAGMAIWAAGEEPERFAGLVLAGPVMRVMPISVFMKVAKKIVGSTPVFWGPFYKSLYKTRKPADFKEYTKALARNLREPGRYKATTAMFEAGHEETEKHYGMLKAPAVVVMGSRDPDFKNPAEEADRCAKLLHAKKVMIEGGGHILPAEYPDEFSAEVIKFVRSIQK
jgi:pimeloyl-ACP methyl ester carboxylesterase